MKLIELRLIAKIVGAEPLAEAHGATRIHTVSTNSKSVPPGSLFVAIRGEKFDGHAFLNDAARSGAVAALIDRKIDHAPVNFPLLFVPDARKAMGSLASYIRRELRGTVIAVAGSNGKTSTKHLIDAALAPKLRGTISPKSFNNDIGVPLAIFPADVEQDYLVLEIGTNHPGEIRALAHIALPDVAVLTNCSQEHLEGLGDLNGVRRENASLIECLHPEGLLIVNGDDPQLLRQIAPFPGRKVTFGLSPSNDLFATDIVCDSSGTQFTLGNSQTRGAVPLLGRHSAINALAALAVGRELGLDDRTILENLRAARGPDMRLQLQDAGDVRVLNDAYNANPASMRAAIETLASLSTPGRKVAVLGDMRELGDSAPDCHREIGRLIGNEYRPDLLICVGPMAALICEEAQRAGLGASHIEIHADAAGAAFALASRVKRGDLVLLKGSRAVGLEAVAKAILAARAPLEAA